MNILDRLTGRRRLRTQIDFVEPNLDGAATPKVQFAKSLTSGDVELTGVKMSATGPDLYRLDEEPMLFMHVAHDDDIDLVPRFGDVMRAYASGPGRLRLVAVHERGPFRHVVYTLSATEGDSPELAAFLAALVAEGGHWERHMGGILLIAFPRGSTLDYRKA